MQNLGRIPVLIKKHLDFILIAILLFILLTPTDVWDRQYGQLHFYFIVFPILALLLALVCTAGLMERKWCLSRWLRENIWLVSFAVSLLIAVLASTNRLLSLSYLPYYFSGIFLVLIIYAGELSYEKIRRIFGFVALALLLTAIYAVFQRIDGVAISASFTNLTVNQNMPGRVDSVFGNPNIYGFSLAALLPIVGAYTFLGKSRLRRVFGAVSFVLGTVALMMTYSRGAWLGFAAGVFLLIALYKPKLIPVVLILGVAAVPLMPDSVKNRALTIFNPNDTSISYRGLLMNCAVQLIAHRPLFGAGLGLETVQTAIHQSFWPSNLDPIYHFYHSHNLFLQLWCEMGILGFVTFLGAVLHNIVRAMRGFYQRSKTSRVLTASLIAGMAAMLLCGMTDCPLNTLRTMLLFWILFGLVGSLKKAEELEPLREQAECGSPLPRAGT